MSGKSEVAKTIQIPGFDPSRYRGPKTLMVNSIQPLPLPASPNCLESKSQYEISSTLSRTDHSNLKSSPKPVSKPYSEEVEKSRHEIESKQSCTGTNKYTATMGKEMRGMKKSKVSNCTVRPQRSIPKPPEIPETREDLLSKLQQDEMQKIRFRIRNKGAIGDLETTSLRDLELARRPLPTRIELVPPATHNHDKSPFDQSTISNSRFLGSKAKDTASFKPSTTPQSSKSQVPEKRGDQGPEKSCLPTGYNKSVDKLIFYDKYDAIDNQDKADSESNTSLQPMCQGDFTSDVKCSLGLRGWDGKLQPASLEWDNRPMCITNTPEFKKIFNSWVTETLLLVVPSPPNKPLKQVSLEKLQNYDWHADGIDLVPPQFSLDRTNASYYGYQGDLEELTRYCKPISAKEYHAEARLDSSNPLNLPVLNETTETLVQNWLAQKNFQKTALLTPDKPPTIPSQPVEPVTFYPNSKCPTINLYLRPAVGTDEPQMREIYNWHILNGLRTAETTEILEIDMMERLQESRHHKLPIIVAVERGKKQTRYDPDDDENQNLRRPRRAANHAQGGKRRQDRIVGWASASDFTAPHYVERISVELEVYVRPECRQQGVGRCLMDKLLESCDRGHIKRGGYPFYVSPAESYLYVAGGGRDLNKLFFIVRTWQFPKSKVTRNGKGRMISKDDCEHDREDDYDVYLKDWLLSWDFEVEGVLKGAGTKDGRFLNIIYFGRETMWKPQEGKIPT